jgi:hypothetical protein
MVRIQFSFNHIYNKIVVFKINKCNTFLLFQTFLAEISQIICVYLYIHLYKCKYMCFNIRIMIVSLIISYIQLYNIISDYILYYLTKFMSEFVTIVGEFDIQNFY